MADTTIEWTDAVWNPTTGCDRVSPGCDHCYALTLAKRLKGMGQAKYQTDGDPRTSGPGFGIAMHDDALTIPLRWRKPRMVFVNSMSDLFHSGVTDEFIAKVFAVMALTPHITYQVLSKRHARLRSLLNRDEFVDEVLWQAGQMGALDRTRAWWPLPNLWLGVSAENQRWADIRIPALLETPAAVRWISAEPLLGPIDLVGPDHRGHGREPDGAMGYWCTDCSTEEELVQWLTVEDRSIPLDWVVTGGESGPNARPFDLDWARALRDQCAEAGVPFLFKQHGGRTPKARGRLLDGRTHDGYPTLAVPA